jgi:Fungal potassium channel
VHGNQSHSSSSFLLKVNLHMSVLISGWKRLLLAEGPRQVLNAITLYSVAKDQDFSFDIHRYQEVYTTVQGIVMSFMLLTVAIWALSAIRLLVAGILYWPLLCHIRGNLKEFCCHRVDKRISKLLADKRQQRRDPTIKKEDTKTIDSNFKATLPNVEFDDGASVLSLPLYPLARTNTNESQLGLLTRTETQSSVGTHYLNRSDTAGSDLSTMTRNTSTTYNAPDRPGIIRQPTLPQLAEDYAIAAEDYVNPYVSPPPQSARGQPLRIDTRPPSVRSGPPTARSGSAMGYNAPARSGSAMGYNTPSRSGSAMGSNAPVRSNSNQLAMTHSERGFGPPPRSQTFGGMTASPRRPERPY